MTRDQQVPWFPAKTHGWGWGPPRVWQGWLVVVVWATLQLLCIVVFLRNDAIASLAGGTALLTIGLIAVCWIKGEKPQWRWGER